MKFTHIICCIKLHVFYKKIMTDNKDEIDTKVYEFDDFFQFSCPSCNVTIIVAKKDIKCKKFICGEFKNGKFVKPHSSKSTCDKLLTKDTINGCGMPIVIKKDHVKIGKHSRK